MMQNRPTFSRRVFLAAAAYALCALSLRPIRHCASQEPPETLRVIDDEQSRAEVLGTWNQLARAVSERNEKRVDELLAAWHKGPRIERREYRSEFMWAVFECLISQGIRTANYLPVVEIYETSDGSRLARLDSVWLDPETGKPRQPPRAGDRTSVGVLTRPPGAEWQVADWVDDGEPFGLGLPVDGLRLDARAAENSLRKWKELNIELSLVNTTDKPISIMLPENRVLEVGFDVVVCAKQPQADGQEKTVNVYRDIDDRLSFYSESVFNGIPCSRLTQHSIQPGAQIALTIQAEVAPGWGDVPVGGDWSIYVVWNGSRLLSLKGESERKFWRHRLASNEIQVVEKK